MSFLFASLEAEYNAPSICVRIAAVLHPSIIILFEVPAQKLRANSSHAFLNERSSIRLPIRRPD